MDWKEKLQSAKQSGQEAFDAKAELAIQENWPKIQKLFHEKVGPAALAAAHDDDTMRTLFKTVFMALPFPLNIAVKEDVFMKCCFKHRDRLLAPGEVAGGSGSV